MKQATSFRLSTSTMTLLKQLAEKENRSLTNMVETLIIDRSRALTFNLEDLATLAQAKEKD